MKVRHKYGPAKIRPAARTTMTAPGLQVAAPASELASPRASKLTR